MSLEGFTYPTRMRIKEQFNETPTEGEKHGEEEIRLSEFLTSSLEVSAGQSGDTVNTLVQGAWALL